MIRPLRGLLAAAAAALFTIAVAVPVQAQVFTQLAWGVNRGSAPSPICLMNGALCATQLGTISGSSYFLTAAGATIASPPASTSAGFAITQSMPATGSGVADVNLNSISVASDGYNVGTNDVSALKITHHFGGGAVGQRIGVNVHVTQDTATNSAGGAIGGYFEGDALANMGGTGTSDTLSKGGAFGLNAQAHCDLTATNLISCTGFESDVFTAGGTTMNSRFGVGAVSFGSVNGAVRDAAYGIWASSGFGGIGFKNALLLSRFGGAAPLTSDGCVICIADAGQTIATGIDLSTETITGNFLAGPGFSVAGTGQTIINGGTNIGLQIADASVTGFLQTSTVLTHSFAIGTLGAQPLAFFTNSGLKASISSTGFWKWEAYAGAAGVIHSDSLGNLTNSLLSLPNDVSGRLGLANGGLNADLSATGGTSQVLKQVSVGAAITVARLACSDLSNAAASCSTDTTVASNISSGTLPAARLPNPTASTLGGIESIAAVSHQFLTTISTSGIPSLAQPAFTDISGSVAASQLPNPTASTLGGVESIAAVSHQFLTSISTAGVPTQAQPACSDLSNAAASCSTDTTVATNISSGTLPAGRLPNPSASTLGGVESIAAVSHQFLTTISTSGVPALAQPAFTDISGTASAAQLPNPSTSTLGGVRAIAAVSHNWINAISTSGIPALTQPDFSDLSGLIATTQVPAHFSTAGSVPTCNATCSSVRAASTDFAGEFTVTAGNTQGIINFAASYTSAPNCVASPVSAGNNVIATLPTTTTLTVAVNGAAGGGGQRIAYVCAGT